VLAASGPETIRKAQIVVLIDGIEHLPHGALDDLVFKGGDAQWTLPPIGFRNISPS
jgi:hypothetical protein